MVGAVAVVHMDPEATARLAAQWCLDMLKENFRRGPEIRTPPTEALRRGFNRKIARELGVRIPTEPHWKFVE